MNLVVKDNALMNASFNLSLVEQRLVLLAIMEARESGKGINANDPLVIHAENYISQFNVHRTTAYQAMKTACDDLFSRQLSYQSISEKGNIQNHKSRWVSEVIYVEQEAVVKLIFAPAVAPLIIRLEKQFTSYDMEQVAKLSSKYAMRLYEILLVWRSTGKVPAMSLDELRKKLGLDVSEYKAMSDFKKYVLELALNQINSHTDITASYEQHKKGVRITGFSFRFKSKTIPIKTIERDPRTGDLFVKLSDAQRHLFGAKLARDPRIQSEYAQKLPSENYEIFGKALADMLLDEANFKIFYPLLLENGYQPPKV